jgi:hypothetical protein
MAKRLELSGGKREEHEHSKEGKILIEHGVVIWCRFEFYEPNCQITLESCRVCCHDETSRFNHTAYVCHHE